MADVEDAIDSLVDIIDGLTPLTAWRSDDDWLVSLEDDNDSFIVVNVLNAGEKDLLSINHFIGKRENSLYNNYGYLDIYRVYVRVITPSRSDSREYCRTIEKYLKVNYDTLNSDIVIRRHTFTTQKLFRISTVKVLYGVEISFDFTYENIWNDEPVQPESPAIVSNIEITEINQKDINIRVSYDQ